MTVVSFLRALIFAAVSIAARSASAQFAFELVQEFDGRDVAGPLLAADLDEDGREDFIFVGVRGGWITPYRGVATGGVVRGTRVYGPLDITGAAAIDGNRDGHVDILLATAGDTAFSLLAGDGRGRFAALRAGRVSRGSRSLATGHVDGDGVPDLALVEPDAASVAFYEGAGSGGLVPRSVQALFATPDEIAIADFDGDGRGDFAARFESLGEVHVFRGVGAFGFVAGPVLRTASPARTMASADVDGNGTTDIVVGTVGALVAFAPIGTEGFPEGVVSATAFDPSGLAASDLDLDGDVDLAMFGEPGYDNLHILAGNGDGRFGSDVRTHLDARLLSSIAPRSMFGTPLPDLFVVSAQGPWYSNVFVLRNASSAALCLAGNVNAAAFDVRSVLFVNDSNGGGDRLVSLLTHEPLTVFMAAPPAEAAMVPFVLYGFAGLADGTEAFLLPGGVGWSCVRMPPSGSSPRLRAIWNSMGHEDVLGVSRFPTPLAPAVVVSRRSGAARPVAFTLQGLIRDRMSPSGKVAVTNGVRVDVR